MSFKLTVKRLVLSVLPKRVAIHLNFLGPKRFIQYWVVQRLFRVNSNVPWPVHWSSIVVAPEKIKRATELPILGHHVGCYIQANNGIQIGKNLRYGPNVHIISADHSLVDYADHRRSNPIVIGDNCWIGSGSILLSGVELGNHVVVAAGSVVTKSIGDNVVVAGVPAKVVKNLPAYTGDPDYKLLS